MGSEARAEGGTTVGPAAPQAGPAAALARLSDGSLARRLRSARALAALAAEPDARGWLARPEPVRHILAALAHEPTPSHDVYDFHHSFRGSASEREITCLVGLFETYRHLLAGLGAAAVQPLVELLDGPVRGVGRFWRFGANDPEVFGAKLVALDVAAAHLPPGDALWPRLARRADEDPFVIIAASLRWAASDPEAAAAAAWDALRDPRRGRLGELRSYAVRLRPLAAPLGLAAVRQALEAPDGWTRRCELLTAGAGDRSWVEMALAARRTNASADARRALDGLIAALDPARLEQLHAGEDRQLSRGSFEPRRELTLSRAAPDGHPGRRLAALVLAAGRGERLGGGKLALPWGDSTVLGTVLGRLRAAGLERRHVVCGHEPERLTSVIAAAGALAVLHPAYADGMLSSVQAGLRSFDAIDAVVLLPGDQPMIATDTIRQIAGAWRPTDGLLIPTYLYQSGHPIVLAAALFAEVERLDPAVGLRQLRDRVPSAVRYLPVDDPAILLDLDTPGDYALHRPPGTPEADEPGVTKSQP